MADLSKDTLLFAAERRRMCTSFRGCEKCPLDGSCILGNCRKNAATDAQILSTVQKWHDEHPIKTYKRDFFEKFPNASKLENGTPYVCRNNIYGDGGRPHTCDKITCTQCWNEPMPEDNT